MKFLASLKKYKETAVVFGANTAIALDREKEKMYNLSMLQM